MPTSPKRKRPDGTVVRFAPSSQRISHLPDEPDDDFEAATRWGEDPSSLATIVGTGAHQAKNEEAVLRLVNAARARAGLRALRADERLRAAAREHSRDMARRDFCAHENPDGLSPADRMRAKFYPDPGAENVARGQKSPQSVMDAWMNSPGHRANLLNADFRAIGVGVFFGRGGPCWTQNFGY
ncbi:CAP domain-containing protein [Amycolatopsis pigmentata]|uniref:CAP domain-containing protein n=1 Tax=Amycolatopsis pigmentata TaxID=450801 RepID=A0ABW5G7B8_9PSEU